MSPPQVTIVTHTTTSYPRPHVLYTLEVVHTNENAVSVKKRYSDFLALDESLGVKGRFALPPKRILATTFIPSAWVDDALIAERKAGLQTYLADVLRAPEYAGSTVLTDFLKPSSTSTSGNVKFELEDALPSTLSRKAALDLADKVAKAGELGDEDGEVHAEATSIAAAYYPDWSVDSWPPEDIWYGKFDILFFAFATPNSSSTLSWDDGATDILKRLVTAANNSGKGTKIVLSVGGWGGSYWFSQAMSSSSNRTTFVNAISSAINTYGLAGVDIDWEYPNSEGAGNPHSSSDAANFLSFLQTLRSKIGSSKIISSAVAHLPWIGSNGSPLTNVSAYAAQMTYVNIMNYDVWGASSSPGPNAPLGNLCGTSTQPQASAQAAFKQWTAAGFPANKLLLGLPLYGYVSNSKKTGLTGSFAPTAEEATTAANSNYLVKPTTDAETGKVSFYNGAHPREKPGEMRTMADLRSYYGQQIAFSQILSSGALVQNADGNYGEAGGFTYGWDDCSDTPFLYRTDQSTVVTFDDTYSLASKASYAKSAGMAGCFTWSLDQDDRYELMDAIRTALGRAPPPS